MKSLVLAIIALASCNAHALDVYEALTATGWDNAQHAPNWAQGKAPGGYNHGRDIGYVFGDHEDKGHDHVKPLDPPNCPPVVPVPGALWLFVSALAGITIIGRRK